MAKVIIEAAINGNAAKKLNPHIGYSPEEIGNDAIATCKAGAAIIHFHVRDPETGKWVHDVPYYAEVYRRSRAACKAMLWPTFPMGDDAAKRFSHFVELAKDPATKPDFGAGDMGSVNLVGYDPATKKLHGDDTVYQNSYPTIRYFLTMSRELGLRPTLQIFDPSFLRAALVFLDQGILTEPLMLKFYLGGPELPFGLPPSLKSLEAYLDMLKGVRANWFAATLGGDNLPMVPLIVSLGGHVRVGLEDYQYTHEGQLSNPQIVERAATVIRAMGHEVATPDEARSILEA
ncbi:MAG TPA: 3-keto-5-aminohexanoate cleavage protein [Candidatus Binataceae bacterium]|nr:3-keto-5-aminohexanoate cleavage protein [Candidatus Binataceae bacterium]